MADSALKVEGLHVHFGAAHILQGVDLDLHSGVTAVVGRNGMGKTTLCNAIMGLAPVSGGKIFIAGQDVTGFSPHQIANLGVGYVPQGRRVWPSLSVEEHLRLVAGRAKGPFTVERIYKIFPRLGERKGNGGAQLSGGEQQMLAIGRALLVQPHLLIMDEPTEGLAPIIVEHVVESLKELGNDISILLIEQNIGVACDISEHVNVMVAGQVARRLSSAELIADPELQRRLIGVSDDINAGDRADRDEQAPPEPQPDTGPVKRHRWTRYGNLTAPKKSGRRTRWDAPAPEPEPEPPAVSVPAPPKTPKAQGSLDISIAATTDRAAYVVGTFDTKGRELLFIKSLLDKKGLRTVTVDVSTSGAPASVSVSAREVASCHPSGADAVFTGDRGSAVTAMTGAFERFVQNRPDLGGIISCGGSGGTALVTPGMRALPIGVGKVMISTVASGDVGHYVGPSDITMMHSVTDIQGLNRISERILANGAHCLAGMIGFTADTPRLDKEAIGITMFGVTTSCISQVQSLLSRDYDCLVFHATGVGGRAMEKLIDNGMMTGALDITTTEIADMLVGGVLAADEDRFGAVIRAKIPYVGSVGALDMVNFHGLEKVPDRFRNRNLYVHNPQITLMRTTADENRRFGHWIAERLNRMSGPVRFLLPLGGVSAIDAPGKPFHDPDADAALFDAIDSTFTQTADRRLVKVQAHINDQKFADALVSAFREVVAQANRKDH